MLTQGEGQKQKLPCLLRPRPLTGIVLLSLHSVGQCKWHGQSRFNGRINRLHFWMRGMSCMYKKGRNVGGHICRQSTTMSKAADNRRGSRLAASEPKEVQQWKIGKCFHVWAKKWQGGLAASDGGSANGTSIIDITSISRHPDGDRVRLEAPRLD